MEKAEAENRSTTAYMDSVFERLLQIHIETRDVVSELLDAQIKRNKK